MPLVNQELLILTEHLSSPPVRSGVRVTRSLVLCAMFCRSFIFFCLFFRLAIVLSVQSSIYGFWLLLSTSPNSYCCMQYFIWIFHYKEYLVLSITCIFIYWTLGLHGNIQRINLIWANNFIRCKQLGITKDQSAVLNFGVGQTAILFPWCIIS